MRVYKGLKKPLNKRQMTYQMAKKGFVSGVIRLDFNDIINIAHVSGYEGVLDLMSEKLTKSCLLTDQEYECVGAEEGELLVLLKGDAVTILS